MRNNAEVTLTLRMYVAGQEPCGAFSSLNTRLTFNDPFSTVFECASPRRMFRPLQTASRK